jgi:polyferredoxin
MSVQTRVRTFTYPRLELTRWAPLRWVLQHRAFQFALILPNLAVFVLVVAAAFFGTPVGNRNFAIIFVWIVWWAALITLLIPIGGRIWCAMCPLPAPGEWLQRRALVARRPGRPFTLGLTWPKAMRNIWLQNGTFLTVALFSALILTRPLATGIVLTLFISLGVLLSLLFERRVFCRYVCPVGGFIGLYAMIAPLELRVKDPQVCVTHKEKDCIRGNARGYPCPWLAYPGNLWRNIDCGLCTECLKVCPKDNVGLFLRPPGQDLLLARAPGWKGRTLDEGYKAFIMLACALIYSAVYTGPWGFLKEWANLSDLQGFVLYAAGFLGLNLFGLPGAFLIAVALARWAARAQVPLRRLFVELAYALIPLELAGWIAFTLSFVLINISYAIPLLSDPLGRGWDLLGTASYPWTPYLPWLVPFLQMPLLWAGLFASLTIAFQILQQNLGTPEAARRALLPVTGFITLITLAFQWLYLG